MTRKKEGVRAPFDVTVDAMPVYVHWRAHAKPWPCPIPGIGQFGSLITFVMTAAWGRERGRDE